MKAVLCDFCGRAFRKFELFPAKMKEFYIGGDFEPDDEIRRKKFHVCGKCLDKFFEELRKEK